MTPTSFEHGLLRLLPSGVRAQLAARPELRKVLENIQWLMLQTAFEAGMGLLVGIWVARYLGPTRYGTLNYSMAFVALGTPLATLGLGALIVRNLVRDEASAPAILGTATFLRSIASVLLVAAAVLAIAIMRPGDSQLHSYIIIVALGYGFRNLGIVESWFQAKVQAKYLTIARVSAVLVSTSIKLVMIAVRAPLLMFVIAMAVELALGTLSQLLLYRATTGVRFSAWRVRRDTAKELLADSWPLIFSGLMSVIYMKIDQVMLGDMRGDTAVGVYSVAVRLSEAFFLVPNMILMSVFPSLVRARQLGQDVYLGRFQRLYDAFVWLAIACGVVVHFVAAFLIRHLYGAAYAAAAPVLAVHIWSGVFWFPGSAGHRYLISENHTKLTLAMTTAGAATNVVLNLVLIPPFGILGAAYATLLSFAVSHWLSAALSPQSRVVFFFFLRALQPIELARRWKPLLTRGA